MHLQKGPDNSAYMSTLSRKLESSSFRLHFKGPSLRMAMKPSGQALLEGRPEVAQLSLLTHLPPLLDSLLPTFLVILLRARPSLEPIESPLRTRQATTKLA